MSWIVPWNGTEYDVDPTEFTGLELSEIKKRTGFNFMGVIRGVLDQDGDAIRALFWTVDRRSNQDLKYGDYAGPSLRVIGPHLMGLEAVSDEMEKWVPPSQSPATPENNGSDPSVDSTDGALQPSTTD